MRARILFDRSALRKKGYESSVSGLVKISDLQVDPNLFTCDSQKNLAPGTASGNTDLSSGMQIKK